MNKIDIVNKIIESECQPKQSVGQGHASPNIALIKYWGKRDEDIHLPANSNVAISLPSKYIAITIEENETDVVQVNEQIYPANHVAVINNSMYFDLFRIENLHFKITAEMNFAPASGLASSSAWYAALVCALDDWFHWQLPLEQLSILARLGSGSACRSLWNGFVAWPRGERADGMDSFGIPIDVSWEQLRLGVLTLTTQPKNVSSREGMARCVSTSPFFESWTHYAEVDFQIMQTVIERLDFTELGRLSEHNAMAMHAVCMSANPPLIYSTPQTLEVINRVWQLREKGIEVYFTQDAGANLILLFLEDEAGRIKDHFPGVEIVAPFKM